MTITYDPTIPQDFLPIIKPRVEAIQHLLPNWCQQLSVTYSTDNPNEFVMTCKSEYAYRMVQLCIFEPFFHEDDWRGNLIHEIQHAIAAPYSTETWHIFNLLKLDPEIMEYISKRLIEAEEAMAQDMTDLIRKLEK